MINLVTFNEAALDYMRQQLEDHQDYRDLDPIDKIIILELVECAVKHYMDGCLISMNKDPGTGKLQ